MAGNSPILDYDSPAVGRPTPPRRLEIILCAGLVLVALHTCIRIEILNAMDGFSLPHDPARWGSGKWRHDRRVNEARWRGLCLRDPAGNPLTRPLTPQEDYAMRTDVARAISNNRLRDCVGTWGMHQYLVAPGALLCCASLLLRSPGRRLRAGLWAALGLMGGCIAMMFHRGYFTSLGI